MGHDVHEEGVIERLLERVVAGAHRVDDGDHGVQAALVNAALRVHISPNDAVHQHLLLVLREVKHELEREPRQILHHLEERQTQLRVLQPVHRDQTQRRQIHRIQQIRNDIAASI